MFRILLLIIYFSFVRIALAEEFIPFVSSQDMRITLETDGRTFSRLLADEMARQGWHTASETLSSVVFYRAVTKEMAATYGVEAALDPENPVYVLTVTGYFYVRPVRVACVSFEASINLEGKHVEREIKKVAVPDQVKKLANSVAEKIAGKPAMWISFRE